MTQQQTSRPGAPSKCGCAQRLSRHGRLVHHAILSALARSGQPPSHADLQRLTAGAGVDLPAALAELAGVDLVVVGAGGRLLAAYPFSAVPTPHRLTLASGTRVFAMCAIDALGVSAMLGQPVTVTSAEPGSGRPVGIQVDGEQATWAPRTTVVLAGATADCCAPSAQRTCGHVNFFTPPAAARAWAGDHPDLSWALLDQTQALAKAVAEFGPLLRHPEP